VIYFLLLSSLSSAQPSADRVRVMTFNAENLFDTVHDEGKDDYAYLPAAQKRSPEHKARCAKLRKAYLKDECLDLDWSDKALELKLSRVAEAVKQADPDIVVLQEIENSRVLESLRKKLAAGYGPGILVEGKDRRGIDQAMLSRLPLEKPAVLHNPELSGGRGILEARFRLPDGALLTVFALHLPAPYQPRKERIRVLQRLNALCPASLSVAAGDFNITEAEDASYRVSERHINGTWAQSQDLGCKSCRGTSYYRGDDSWSFLDRILLSKDLASGGGWSVDPGSIRVAYEARSEREEDGTPARFDAHFGTGVSDHFPVVLDLVRRSKP